MHPEPDVLLHAVVEAVRTPRIREEHQRDGLAEVVQLQTARAGGVHDRRVVDHARRDAQRARAQYNVRVRCCSARVGDQQSSRQDSV